MSFGAEEKGKNKYILCKRTRQRLLARDLLRADETLDRDGDGAVDVLHGAVVREAHLAEGFGDADDGFEVADLWGFLVRICVKRGGGVSGKEEKQ